jgi:hypothetical protein
LGFPILLESGKEIFLNKKGPGKKIMQKQGQVIIFELGNQ